MRTSMLALASLSLALSLGCTGTFGGGEPSPQGGCDSDCVARCQGECTNSSDSIGYDECMEGCSCGCDRESS